MEIKLVFFDKKNNFLFFSFFFFSLKFYSDMFPFAKFNIMVIFVISVKFRTMQRPPIMQLGGGGATLMCKYFRIFLFFTIKKNYFKKKFIVWYDNKFDNDLKNNAIKYIFNAN